VKVDLIRPETPADVFSRVSGVGKPAREILFERNNAFNTSGTWRRVVAPLDIVGEETNLFVRFSLLSDETGVAGGWYIDDVAIIQGGEINATFAPGTYVTVTGINPNNNVLFSGTAGQNGFVEFGPLPQGDYLIGSSLPSLDDFSIGEGADASQNVSEPTEHDVVIATFAMGSPLEITWPSVPGMNYRVEVTEDLHSGSWQFLANVATSGLTGTYIDGSAAIGLKFYRIVLQQP
jgi:hypothetical protein